MSAGRVSTPVAMFIYNRADLTRRVFQEIARARPSKLFIVADGPRRDRPGDKARCDAARGVIRSIDWDCEVQTNLAESNMGCGERVSSGLDWVFQNVEEAIILEDDCLPHPTFFRFCEELLKHYRHDSRVMHISGDNFQFGKPRGEGSYYFSRYPHIWGWASWRRAWQHYDVDMRMWASQGNRKDYLDVFTDELERRFWRNTWQSVCEGKIDTWDYQWVFSCVARKGLSVVPNVNLVSNIGFGEDATHGGGTSIVAHLPGGDLRFPLRHPSRFQWDEKADRETGKLFFRDLSVRRRLFTAMRRRFRARLNLSALDQ
jgi:hypothetical protein